MVVPNVSLADQEKLEDAGEEILQATIDLKENLFDDLSSAFQEQGINAYIDKNTGEIYLDAVILFGGDSAVLSEEGKALYSKFINAYLSVIFYEKYNGFIKQTIIE